MNLRARLERLERRTRATPAAVTWWHGIMALQAEDEGREPSIDRLPLNEDAAAAVLSWWQAIGEEAGAAELVDLQDRFGGLRL